MIVVLTEEPSMSVALRSLFATQWPDRVRGVDWHIISFRGKADLERRMIEKMRSWNYGSPHFVILRDNDGADCRALKEKIRFDAEKGKKPHHVRIVCQELESWFIGDPDAVTLAYPGCHFQASAAKYRNPDRLNNASQELTNIIDERGKVGRAERIAPYMQPGRNRSGSFRLAFQTFADLLS